MKPYPVSCVSSRTEYEYAPGHTVPQRGPNVENTARLRRCTLPTSAKAGKDVIALILPKKRWDYVWIKKRRDRTKIHSVELLMTRGSPHHAEDVIVFCGISWQGAPSKPLPCSPFPALCWCLWVLQFSVPGVARPRRSQLELGGGVGALLIDTSLIFGLGNAAGCIEIFA